MSTREYRLTSMQDPTDEMLQEIMQQVAESARESSAKAISIHEQKLAELIKRKNERKATA